MSVLYKNADVVKRYKLNQHYFEKLNELSQTVVSNIHLELKYGLLR